MNEQVDSRYKRAVKLPKPEKCDLLKASYSPSEIFVRHKRDKSIDPIEIKEQSEENEEYVRAKRRVASALEEYSNCRKNNGNEKSCEIIHQKMLKMASDLSAKFSEMKEFLNSLKTKINSVEDQKHGLHTIANEHLGKLPRFHEDMNEKSDERKQTVEHIVRSKQMPIDPNLSGIDTAISTFRDNEKNSSPGKNENFGKKKKWNINLVR